MPYLEKNHDPRRNAAILAEFTSQFDLTKVIQEAEQYFNPTRLRETSHRGKNVKHSTGSLSQKLAGIFFRLLSTKSTTVSRGKVIVDKAEGVIPDWKDLLDNEFVHLENNIKKVVNVVDYGAVGDGKTDNTLAFKKAIGNGNVKVIVPAGVFITKGIQLPSFTLLVGAGKGVTTIKLHDTAKKGTRLITNADHWKGNHHLFVGALSLDWNVERLGNVAKTSAWGNHSSCLTYANVTYGWVRDIEAMNPGLHCFDISSTLYNYAGDGFRARGGSKYVWLDNLNGYGFGDDGITTHHSEYIFISRCHMCDPSGRAHKKGFSNSNGIEVDDGSRNVVLVNNSSSRCFGGVEIKAHENSSAASNVHIVGHISVNDNRSFNFRHIGHHKSSDAESKTAYNICAANLVAIAPIFTELYKGSTPRGMVISAYKNVVINHFTLIGDPTYDYKGHPVIAVQYRARNILLKHIKVKNFKHAGSDIKVFGGENRADSIQICNVASQDSAPKVIEIGPGIEDVTIENPKSVHNYL
ncbi:glycoside hydrolase family 55 protein [Neobacillus sp. MER 74]|uniref:glycosyl hydrolase family 28-related protein n=1 Tax=Bacillaceae TaxID=186817 RepID=UPI000BF8024F|nr:MULTISPECIES: glycosyl hydrolase family 28-related protein [Bacillaceae]MCM3115975.1 glycoside hydrolase family 55 protein [Neobacillus sp. MER 74]PFP24584.1 pectate lyase [Bacillus sp. AFS073361]